MQRQDGAGRKLPNTEAKAAEQILKKPSRAAQAWRKAADFTCRALAEGLMTSIHHAAEERRERRSLDFEGKVRSFFSKMIGHEKASWMMQSVGPEKAKWICEALPELEKMLSEQKRHGDLAWYCLGIVAPVIEKSGSVEQFKAWKNSIDALGAKFRAYGNPYHPLKELTPLLMARSAIPGEFDRLGESVDAMMREYAGIAGEQGKAKPLEMDAYVRGMLANLLRKFADFKQVKAWDKKIKTALRGYVKKYGDPYWFAFGTIPVIIEKSPDLATFKVWHDEVKKAVDSYWRKYGKPDPLLTQTLSALLKKSGSIESFRKWESASRKIFADYAREFGNPKIFTGRIFPKLLEKSESPTELHRWAYEACEVIRPFVGKNGANGSTDDFLGKKVPGIIARSRTPGQMHEPEEKQPLIKLPRVTAVDKARAVDDYRKRFGEPDAYSAAVMPEIEKKSTPGEFFKWDRAAKELIDAFVKANGGNGRLEGFVSQELPEIIIQCSSAEELRGKTAGLSTQN